MVQHIYRYHAPECESNRRSSGKDKTFFIRSPLYTVPDAGSRCQYYINRLIYIKKFFLCEAAENCQSKAGYGNVARAFLVKGGRAFRYLTQPSITPAKETVCRMSGSLSDSSERHSFRESVLSTTGSFL